MTLQEILSKSQSAEVQRSQLHFADYNPRKISPEGKKTLKKSIKQFGVVGGIVVNKNGYTIVGGHQKVAILDELAKGKDYTLRVELIDVDIATEKALNVALNNPNVGGEWDYDKLATLVPDIDWQAAGLTEADLSFIGVDYLFQTETIDEMASELSEMHEISKPITPPKPKKTVEELKATKQQVKEHAQQKAESLNSYVVLFFENDTNKSNFLQRFGYSPTQQYLKGEDFDEKCEVVYD